MRLLFIKPRFIERGLNVITPPIGLAYLASYLREREKDAKIKILDMLFHNEEDLIDEIKNFSPDVVGISSLTVEADSMHRIALLTKRISRNIVVVAGGPHPTLFPRDVLSDGNIDYVVKGEGEKTFHELFISLYGGRKPYDVKGIFYRRNGEIIFTGDREPIYDLDSIPFPAWDLLEVEKYRITRKFTLVRSEFKYLPIFTSRACPYGCIYCHRIFGRGFRKRSPQNVIAEMEEFIGRFGIEKFEVIDDIFNLDEERAKAICEEIIKRKWKILLSFPNGLRGDRLSFDTISLLRKAGTYYISFAIESASERIQKLIKKNLDIQKTLKAIEDAVKMGIFTMGYFMLGFPTETEDEIRLTIECAKRSKLHIALFFIVTPFKGTELYETYVGDAFIPYKRHHYHTDHYNLSAVDTKTLKELYKLAYRKFYSSPYRAFRILRDYPTGKAGIIKQFLSLFIEGFTTPEKMRY